MFTFLKRLLNGGRSVNELSKYVGLPVDTLLACKDKIPKKYYYTEFNIPKRRGGYRTISAPNDDLKNIQKLLLQRLFKTKLHPCATGYIRGKSIIDNAIPHVNNEIVIQMDLADFFPSLSYERVENCVRSLGWNKEATKIITNLCCHNNSLPQGAPTSPVLSNMICLKLDTRLEKLSKKLGAKYTRYADDITFSMKSDRGNYRYLISKSIQIIKSEKLTIQKAKKIRVRRAHHQQKITGLVVNQKLQIPKVTRHRMRALKHKLSLNLLPESEKAKLQGYISFEKSITKHTTAKSIYNFMEIIWGLNTGHNLEKSKKTQIQY